jgi:hypothetical protein
LKNRTPCESTHNTAKWVRYNCDKYGVCVILWTFACYTMYMFILHIIKCYFNITFVFKVLQMYIIIVAIVYMILLASAYIGIGETSLSKVGHL